jgi:hypothetical protein
MATTGRVVSQGLLHSLDDVARHFVGCFGTSFPRILGAVSGLNLLGTIHVNSGRREQT